MARSPTEQQASNSVQKTASLAGAQSRRDAEDVADAESAPPRDGDADADRRPGAADERLGHGSRALAVTPRFRIFIIDSGWNSVAGKVLRDNLPLFNDLTPDHPVYLVDRATSVKLLRRHQGFVGCDPIISVHDLKAFERRRRGEVYGVRAHLGLLREEKAVINLMQVLAGFLSRYRHSEEFEAGVRNELRLEGLQGAIEIVMGAVEHKELIA